MKLGFNLFEIPEHYKTQQGDKITPVVILFWLPSGQHVFSRLHYKRDTQLAVEAIWVGVKRLHFFHATILPVFWIYHPREMTETT